MTVVVGTAGHIDHGKTALLRALTGIDADRLPEERSRGMTIDVGYAHMTLADGAELDFVDVPGHDRLVGNMLVGAGEIDAAMLVIAADEGPKAQTLEHLGLLDALGIDDGVAVLTKLDLLAPTDPRRTSRADEVRALLAPTTLAGIPGRGRLGGQRRGPRGVAGRAGRPPGARCPTRHRRRAERDWPSIASSLPAAAAWWSPAPCAVARSPEGSRCGWSRRDARARARGAGPRRGRRGDTGGGPRGAQPGRRRAG